LYCKPPDFGERAVHIKDPKKMIGFASSATALMACFMEDIPKHNSSPQGIRTHPGGNLGANIKFITHRCNLILVASV